MPRIRPYETQTQVQGATGLGKASPDAFGHRGVSQLGAAIEGVGDQLQRRQEQTEVSELNAKLAEARAKYTTNLAERLRTADPNDKTVVPKFLEEFDSETATLEDEVSTGA